MKRIMKIQYTLLIAGLCLALGAVAQGPNAGKKPSGKEILMAVRAREVQSALGLDDNAMERFRPLYERYDKDISRINTERQKMLMKSNIDTLSNADAEAMMAAQIRTARTILDIQEQYSREFSSVLTPQQILRFFRTEKDIRRKALAEYRKRFPPKPKPSAQQ